MPRALGGATGTRRTQGSRGNLGGGVVRPGRHAALACGTRLPAALRGAASGLAQAQRLLGHSDPKLTMAVYTHLETKDLRGAVEGLPVLRAIDG